MKQYIVYIVRCGDNSYYTGITNDLSRRLLEHNEGMDPKSYTFNKRPVTLQFQYAFEEVRFAIAMEKQIKGWSRKKKEALIRGEFDLLPILSENNRQRRMREIRNAMRNSLSTDAGVMPRSLEA